jgi:hypothetical protein
MTDTVDAVVVTRPIDGESRYARCKRRASRFVVDVLFGFTGVAFIADGDPELAMLFALTGGLAGVGAMCEIALKPCVPARYLRAFYVLLACVFLDRFVVWHVRKPSPLARSFATTALMFALDETDLSVRTVLTAVAAGFVAASPDIVLGLLLAYSALPKVHNLWSLVWLPIHLLIAALIGFGSYFYASAVFNVMPPVEVTFCMVRYLRPAGERRRTRAVRVSARVALVVSATSALAFVLVAVTPTPASLTKTTT